MRAVGPSSLAVALLALERSRERAHYHGTAVLQRRSRDLMPTTWILIADGARARLLEQDRKSRHFNPTSEQEFFGSRA